MFMELVSLPRLDAAELTLVTCLDLLLLDDVAQMLRRVTIPETQGGNRRSWYLFLLDILIFYAIEIEVSSFKGQADALGSLSLVFDQHLKRHLGIIKQPVLRIEAQLILTVNKGYMNANVETVLELGAKIQQHRLFANKSETCLIISRFNIGCDLNVLITV